MSNRVDYYFRQRVTEAELDLGFELLEQADRNLAADIGIYGVVSGAVPAPHQPVANLTIDLTAPGRAYDHLGQRVFFGTGQNVNCAVDMTGLPTDVSSSGNERWLGVFLRFRRLLSDPRTDGNSQQVYFRRDESFEIVVRQAPEGPVGSAVRVGLLEDELLVCDVKRRAGQTQIIATDIDITRRQAFIITQGSTVSVATQGWTLLKPVPATVQATLDQVDLELARHFGGTARRHTAANVDSQAYGFIGATNVQAALNEIVDDLGSTAANLSGARRIGAEGVAGTTAALAVGSVYSQLAALLGYLNNHLEATGGAHSATAVSVADFSGRITASDVMGALSQIVDAFERNHIWSNSSSNGIHRAITQPALGSGRVSIWSSAGNGSATSQMSAYLDDAGLTFVFNAVWTGASWQKVATSAPAGGVRFGNNGLEVLIESSTSLSFTNWTRTLKLSLSNATTEIGFEATGTLTATGRCGSRVRNGEAATRSLGSGHAVTFRYRFPAAPSSISLTGLTSSTPYPTVSADSVTADGFVFSMNADVSANGTGYWYGTYTAYG